MIDPKDLIFKEEGHEYFYKGVLVPSNTQLLKEFGLIDFEGVPQDRLEYKQKVGRAVHLAASLLDFGTLDENSVSPLIAGYLLAWEKFKAVHKFKPRLNETPLYSRKWRFATTLDRQGTLEWKGKRLEVILEIKCTWELHWSTGPQTAGQKIAFEENHPEIPIAGRFCCHLRPDQNFELIRFDNKEDVTTFLACVHLHYRKKRGG
jgi:hypothetical protein